MHGTRVQILREIEFWIMNPRSQQIFWLTGMAGTGKSAIAWTVCSYAWADANVVLGGSFFCSRSSGSVSQRDVRCIVPTLAQLLARQSTEFSKALAVELDTDPDILHKHVSVQVQRLLYAPLVSLRESPRPILFVIDALDECGDRSAGEDAESCLIVSEMIVALVAFSTSDDRLPVKFLITSRPETHIRDTPVSDSAFSNVLRLHTVNEEQVTADIRLYVRTTLTSNSRLCSLFTANDADTLTQVCNGLFIIATTALQYTLGAGIDRARIRFETLLKSSHDSPSARAAATSLDCMYAVIVEDAVNTDKAEICDIPPTRQLLAVLLSARVSLSITALADILDVPSHHLRAGLSRLHAVVHVPEDDSEPGLRTLHASFGDYLTGRAPENIRIVASLGDEVIARGCLRVMSKCLHFNISQSRSSFEPNVVSKSKIIPSSLEYACLQWIYHIAALPVPSVLDNEIDTVFRPRFLFWLEVISVLGKVWPRAAAMMLFAASTVSVITNWFRIFFHAGPQVQIKELSLFLRDAQAFIASSREALEQCAPHIYLSALPFAAKDSLVYKLFSPLCTGLVSVDTLGINRHGGRLIMTLTGHEAGVNSVVYSPDGLFVASGSDDGTVRVWDTRTGEETMSPLKSGNGVVTSVDFSPNGSSIAAGMDEGFVCMWSLLGSRQSLQRLSGHSGSVRSVAFAADGVLLASGSQDCTLRLWMVGTGKQPLVLTGHTGPVNAVAFSTDGTTIASGSGDGTIRLWSVSTCQHVGEALQDENINSICFSPDGSKLAVSCAFLDVKIWDIQTRTCIRIPHGFSRFVRFSSDGQMLVCAAKSTGIVFIRNWSQDSNMVIFRGHTDSAQCASFSPDGLYMASASDDRTVRIWDARTSQQAVQPLLAHENAIHSVAISPNGALIVSGSQDSSVCIWNANTGEPWLTPLVGHTDSVHSVCISPNGYLIASASSDKTIRLWNMQTMEAVGEPLQGHKNFVTAVAFSPDSCWLASGSLDGAVRIWDTTTGYSSIIHRLRSPGRVWTVNFSPDGVLVAAGGFGGQIHIWYSDTGQPFCNSLQANTEDIVSICFSPDGTRVVSGAKDCTIRIWDVDKGEQLLLQENRNSRVAPYHRYGSDVPIPAARELPSRDSATLLAVARARSSLGCP